MYLMFGYADAVVRHGNFNKLRQHGDEYSYYSAAIRVFNRIIKKILQHQVHFRSVNVKFWQRSLGWFKYYFNIFWSGLLRISFNKLGDIINKINRGKAITKAPLLNARHVQEIADQSDHTFINLISALQELTLFFANCAEIAISHHFDSPLDRGERSAKLVGGNRNKFRFHLAHNPFTRLLLT